MSRFGVILCLLVAVTGNPLRHAEAAEDLARSLKELTSRTILEPVDGGVGDDAGETIRSAAPADSVLSTAGGLAIVGSGHGTNLVFTPLILNHGPSPFSPLIGILETGRRLAMLQQLRL